ncbi:MAG: hypothetical protein FWH40_07880 [Coriobacteriia bacterium]|nr:hypothetical protein [Coriobacteriia bacterium]
MEFVINDFAKSIDLQSINTRFQLFHIDYSKPIQVTFFTSRRLFTERLIDEGANPPPWLLAYQDQQGIYALDPDLWDPETSSGSLEEVIAHEAAHIVLQSMKTEIPLWIYEGFAMLVAGQIPLDDELGPLLTNPYSLDYESEDLYYTIAQAMVVLSAQINEFELVRRILEVDDYVNDSLFGFEAMREAVKR